MNWYLKCYDYVLSDINYEFDEQGNIIIKDFLIGKELIKTFWLFEVAEEIRKKINIETGLNLTVKRFKEDKKEEE